MQKTSLLLTLSLLSVFFSSSPLKCDAASIGDGGGGTIPGTVYSVSPGAGVKTALGNARNNSTYQLGSGNYTVTPSILNSNLSAGNQFTGISFLNKTNVTIQGVVGRTIIDGSSGLGELLWMSNCSNIRIVGVTFKGMTNHNFMMLPPVSSAGSYLWASVNVYQCEKIEFLNCSWLGSADHGLQDKGAENSGVVASVAISTNGILVDTCYFSDIGGWRTNANAGGSIVLDGTAIVPTGWTIRNCTFENCMRGVEPYNENDAGGIVFVNCSIQRNNFLNMADQAICTAGSTNGHEIVISDNFYDETAVISYHGTNLLTTGTASAIGYAIAINGGRGHNINNNTINRARYVGIALGGNVMDDCTLDGNKVYRVGNGVSGFGYILGAENANVKPVTRLNFFNNTAKATTQRGLYILGVRDGYFRNCTIENPTLYGAVGNVVNASGNNRNTNLFFTSCTFTDNTGFQTHGMSIAAGNVNINFTDCVISGGSAGKYDNSAGDEVTIWGPSKTFSTTVNLGSIPASGQLIGNFSAPGIRTNDLVSLMLPNQFFGVGNVTNVSVTSWASNSTTSDGVVFYNIKNLDTVSAADAQNVRIRATVRQVEAY